MVEARQIEGGLKKLCKQTRFGYKTRKKSINAKILTMEVRIVSYKSESNTCSGRVPFDLELLSAQNYYEDCCNEIGPSKHLICCLW